MNVQAGYGRKAGILNCPDILFTCMSDQTHKKKRIETKRRAKEKQRNRDPFAIGLKKISNKIKPIKKFSIPVRRSEPLILSEIGMKIFIVRHHNNSLVCVHKGGVAGPNI